MFFSILSCSTERLTLKRYGLQPAQIVVKGNKAYINGTRGKLLYNEGLKTELTPNSVVTSGGTDLFVSGKSVAIAPGAKIGGSCLE